MNLLPKSVKEFGSKSYWDSFFRKRKDVFEWYGDYSDLCGVLHKYCKPNDHVLIAGCGNSKLSEDLYDVGYRSLINVDISEVVIKQMQAKNKAKRPEMQFRKMDLLDLKFEDENFNVVIDKGTLDAIFTGRAEKIVDEVHKMLAEISRVLKTGGRYICISLAQEHILETLLEYFPKLNWFIRIHKVDISTSASSLPVFAFVFTKTRPNPSSTVTLPLILEIATDSSDKVSRLDSILEMSKSVLAIQEYALVKQHLRKLHSGEHFQMELWSEGSLKEPRYTITIVDIHPSKAKSGMFAVFIVPQGREHEWMFSVKEGLDELAASAGFQRLVIVALSRGHVFTSLDKVKEELSCKVMELAQEDVSAAIQAPFLSIGDDVGNRKEIHQGCSAFTGDFVIEDVQLDENETYRHLIFLSNKNVVQSEARLCNDVTIVQSKSKKKKKKGAKKDSAKHVDFSYLACQYHHAIVAGFAALEKMRSNHVTVLLIGLGGGGLPMFIHHHFPDVHLTVVELDPDIAEVAKKWFDFQESERMNLIIGDGLQVMKEFVTKSTKKYDIVVYDVNSKDASKALVCPPPQFVERETMEAVKSILHPGGLLIMNLVCRDKKKKQEVVKKVQQVLPHTYNIDIENEVNEIIIGKNSNIQEAQHIANSGVQLQEQITAVSPESNIELASFLQNLKIV